MYSYLCGLIANSSALEHALSSTRLCVRSRFSHVQFFATPWTIARQAPVSMGLSRQEYWSGLPFPSLSTEELMLLNCGVGEDS